MKSENYKIAAKKRWSFISYREKMIEAAKKRFERSGERERFSQLMKKSHARQKVKNRLSKAQTKRFRKKEERLKLHNAAEKFWTKEERRIVEIRMRNRWKDPEYITKMTSLFIKGMNKSEKRLFDIINKVDPKRWEFVGDGKVWINAKCPDFIQINGKKLIIELFGDYWHGKRDVEERKKHFGKYGYETLIIWESQLKECPEKIKDEIKTFCV